MSGMDSNITAAPIVVEASQYFEGNDGPWSTFHIHVGTPPQPARVLVGTALGDTRVISANQTTGYSACPPEVLNPFGNTSQLLTNCAVDRGALVNVNTSSTWQDQGLYELGNHKDLPDYSQYYQSGDYGLDTMGVGLPVFNDYDEPGVTVTAIVAGDFYLGLLGVNRLPTNFSDFVPHPSYLSALRDSEKIPSLSYGYTAGAPYRFKKVYGSLTLGGYDASKYEPNNVDFLFADDISRDLVVGVQLITYADSTHQSGATDQLLSSSNDAHLTFIDATIPHIWLPQNVCTAFENAFGLTYNDTIDRYLVNDTLHEQLQSRNPSISFILGNQRIGGDTVNITLPYQAFDLTLEPTIPATLDIDSPKRYFPIRRGDNDTQYTLGRTFLQEAYLITNYEHNNFSVLQNKWVENAPSEILAIRAANSTAAEINATSTKSGISIGAIAGIVVAVVVLLLFTAAAVAYFLIRKRRKRKVEEVTKKEEEDAFRKAEMDGTGKPPIGELYSEHKLGEADSSSKIEMQGSQPGLSAYDKNKAEMEGTAGGVEMEGTKGGVEMEGSKLRAEMDGGRLRAEMDGDYLAPVELYAGPQGLSELPSPATSSSELPSPLSSSNERRAGAARWSRKSKSVPKLPDSESSDFSPDAETPGRGSGANMWGKSPRSLTPNDESYPSSDSRNRRPSVPSPGPISSPSSPGNYSRSNDPSQRSHQLEVPSGAVTAGNLPSPISTRRERQRNAGNALDRRMQNRSPLSGGGARDSSEDRGDSSRQSRRNHESMVSGVPPRSETTSPFDSASERSAEMFDRRRPSPLSSGGSPARSPPADPASGRGPKPSTNFF